MALLATTNGITNLINRDTAVTMVKEYKDRLGTNSLIHSHYVHFSLNELECFFQKMKAEKADGCRMYFAAHLNGHTGKNPNDVQHDDDYSSRMTVILVATERKQVNGKYYDHEIIVPNLELDCENMELEVPEELQVKGKKKVLDFGTLCPPRELHEIGKDLSIHYDAYSY